MSEARANFGATTTDDGSIVVVGGLSRPAGEMIDFTLKTCEKLDVRRGTWSRLPDLHEPRQGCSCTAISGGRVAVVGGKGLQSCELLEWCDDTPAWSRLPPLTIERGFASAASWQPAHALQWGEQPAEHLIVMGGQDSYWTVHKDGERLRIGQAGALPCTPDQIAARSAAAAAVDSSLSVSSHVAVACGCWFCFVERLLVVYTQDTPALD